MNRIALGQHALTSSLNSQKKTYIPSRGGGPTFWRIYRLFAVYSTAIVFCLMLGATPPADAGSVTLSPGANIQSAVNSNPAGTTFVLQAGVYHWQGVTSPKNGDSFIGQTGAIMDGAEVLTGWTQVSIKGALYWTTAGGTPKLTPGCGATPLSACCESGYPGCAYVQNLYVNDVEYQHVTSLASIVAGMSWYYDFNGTDGGIQNNVYLAAGDNPNSDTVELGVISQAFGGTASNITIENLIIEKYATALDSGVVEVQGPYWLIKNNEIRLNHGIGISDGYGGNYIQVLSNNVHDNGEFGVGGPANNGLWDSNTIAYNNADHVDAGGSAGGGGSKFTGNYVTISNNIVHDNDGPGLWTDCGAIYDTYDHNTSYNNNGGGIRYEISRYGTITNNVAYGNASNPQITYTGSDHGRISGNTAVDTGLGGITMLNSYGSRQGTVYPVTDVQITNNTIWTSSTGAYPAASLVDKAAPAQPGIFSDPTNFFDYNIYEFPASSRSAWHWSETTNPYQLITWSAWQADLQDLHGQVITNVPAPTNLPR